MNSKLKSVKVKANIQGSFLPQKQISKFTICHKKNNHFRNGNSRNYKGQSPSAASPKKEWEIFIIDEREEHDFQ